uniref:Glutathione peroxidase n=1 Tax=Daucus carota subsp. sativus TaxID=79200 RepID=A0A166FAV0_DAUCS
MASQSSNAQSIHDFTVKDAKGNDVELSKYKGKVLMIVNVASQCGLTNSNYTELAQLYEKYKNQGLEILAFPCNQFGAQEPGSNEQIVEFACTRFKAEYPIFDKIKIGSSMATASDKPKSVHDFTVKDAKGNDVNLSQYKGKVLLIVNVASQCGLTNSNYTELAKLYEKYKDQGLEILAFPCNQFGSQEPGTNEEIVEFACTKFKAEYPIFDKKDIKKLLEKA